MTARRSSKGVLCPVYSRLTVGRLSLSTAIAVESVVEGRTSFLDAGFSVSTTQVWLRWSSSHYMSVTNDYSS